MISPQNAVALVPDGLDPYEAAPLLCAGITTYKALRNSGARGGDLVAVQGIGGLGHLALQFAHKMGFKTVAISRGKDKEKLAKELGADFYIDSSAGNPGEKLAALGGADIILATVPAGKAVSPLVDGLAPNGKLIVEGASTEIIEISPLQLILGRKSVAGWASGHAMDSQDTMNFSHLTGIKSMIEVFPLEKANEAFQKMMENKVRFRSVLKIL